MEADPPVAVLPKKKYRPFWAAVFRGLSVLLPPLMTVVILVWVGTTINQQILHPVEDGARQGLLWLLSDVRTEIPGADPQSPTAELDGKEYTRLESGQYVPSHVFQYVKEHQTQGSLPMSGDAMFRSYIDLRFLQPYIVVPIFVVAFLLIIYLLGKLLAFGFGTFLWDAVERLIGRLPLIRNVYSSVKQVTDFIIDVKPSQFTRVVAVEYPCKGVWSVGLVTSESLSDIRAAANEPVLAVLIPCSPMPMAARNVTVRKREVLELNLTVDQALQFIVSCGVVVPPHQRPAPFSKNAPVLGSGGTTGPAIQGA